MGKLKSEFQLNKVKQLIKYLVPADVLNFFRTLFGGWAIRSYSQEGEDMILRRIFKDKQSGFYVDVGAHHPIRFSNTYAFYKRGWRGINIEPNPESIKMFRKLRSKDINLNLGVAEREGKLRYFMFNESALNTFDSDLAETRLKNPEYRIESEINVEVTTLEKILDQSQLAFDQIDFLTVDVEGMDLDVLKSNNWSKYKPRWVLVEQLGLTDLENIDFETHIFMKSNGYILFAKTFNTLFFKLKVEHCAT